MKRLRAEIEPVAARDFLRFLFDWQRVAVDARMQGPEALGELVGQLEGFEAPAGAWETAILPARFAQYESSWLDDHCLAGHITWARLRPRNGGANGERKAAPVRSTPITLLERRHAQLWASLPAVADPAPLTAPAGAVADFLQENGASFFEELADGTGLLRTQVEDALAELVTLGLVSSDSFGGLRALLVPAERRQRCAIGRGRRKPTPFGMEIAGRWGLARRGQLSQNRSAGNGARAGSEAVEHMARTLLRRYGVVFWRLLEREANWLPPWRELLHVYRKLEARGEIRGGRFVAGFAGEQFALPEAIGALREARRRNGDSGVLVSLSGADPLNLAGILTPGPKLAGLTRNRVLYRDGIPIALLESGEIRFLETLEAGSEWEAHKTLLRSSVPAPLTHLS
ncbi:MAG TPA: hypothetical protein VFY53_08330 [Rhodoplanes sp.]|nr:hypothetical protein [Rhodoplanes sp.]